MSQAIAGTFTHSGTNVTPQFSAELLVPQGVTTARLTTRGCDANNTLKTQKRTVPGGTFADQVTYNSEQASTAITVAANEEWRLTNIAGQVSKALQYNFRVEAS